MTTSLSGKTTIFIGGASGIGLAAAKIALDEGATVTIADVSIKHLGNVATELGDKVTAFEVDVNDSAAVASLFTKFDRIDHIFLTAGKLDRGNTSALKAHLSALREVLETRLIGAVNVVRSAHSKLQPGGSIVLSSGLDGTRSGTDSTMAAASVDGVIGLTRALALDLAPIRCNCVMPGLINTPLWEGIEGFQKFADAFVQKLPVRRMGQAEDVAEGAIFLMKNSYITGTTLNIDGGAPLV